MTVKTIVVVPENEYGEGLTIEAYTASYLRGQVKTVSIRTGEDDAAFFDETHLDALIEALQQLRQ